MALCFLQVPTMPVPVPDEQTGIVGILLWVVGLSLAANVAQWRERIAEKERQRKDYEALWSRVVDGERGAKGSKNG